MKACTLCKVEKDESEFYVRNKETGLLRRECKACIKERDKINRDPEANKAACSQYYNTHRAEVAQYNREQAALKKTYIAEVKKAPCTDCHRCFPDYVMDFDHVPGRGQKVTGVSRMILGTYSLESVKAEVAKCDLVCSNCHRIRTHDREWTRDFKAHHPRKEAAV